jgi:hypothetical protein
VRVKSTIAIKVNYWAEQVGETTLREPEGIDDFREELSQNYFSVVQGQPGDLGGGLYHLAVELISSVTLAGIAGYLASNIAWDIIKAGTTTFVLRPLVDAYRKLRERNREIDVDVETLSIVFQDTLLIVHRIGPDSIVTNLEEILRTVGREYAHLLRPSGEKPFSIRIPVFEDHAHDRLSRFRELLDVDETIQPKAADYFGFWGVEYVFSRITCVYDAHAHQTLDAEFLTIDRYSEEWDRRYRLSTTE